MPTTSPGSPAEARINGLVLTEHEITVPLDHEDPAGEQITLFAREVAAPDGADRPVLLFLQGGPGTEGPRPTVGPTSPSWLDTALEHHRVLLLDDRGTGRSAPIGDLGDLAPQQQADHLGLFRADSIVADAELLRAHLSLDRWSVLGQSFGGFCLLHYLCVAPGSIRAALFTGGLPPVGRPIDDVYAATYATMRERIGQYYARYPADLDRMRCLLDLCAEGRIVLPGGDVVAPHRARHVGNVLGMSYGAEHLHHLLELAPLSRVFRHDLAAALPFTGRNPLYSLLQESCYADGSVTAWGADRCLPEDFRDDPTLFFGEHVFPATVADDSELAPYTAAADLLAHRRWPRLYDEEALRGCEVPAAAAIYAHDAYVDRALSEETAALVPGLRAWVTAEYEHNGLRTHGGAVLGRLLSLTTGG